MVLNSLLMTQTETVAIQNIVANSKLPLDTKIQINMKMKLKMRNIKIEANITTYLLS